MKKVVLVLAVLLSMAGITAGCDNCEEDHQMFWDCYNRCPCSTDKTACVDACINSWYCADRDGFCDFYDPFCDPFNF